MSRGPGSVESVVAALLAKRDRAFTITELARRAFTLRGNAKPTRAQRLSATRAAHRAMARVNTAAGRTVIVCERVGGGGGGARFRRMHCDFYSPPPLVDAARMLYGGVIDLDPASHADANENVQASRYYTVEDDGLAQPWHGRIWLNPPYNSWGPWVTKLLAERLTGNVEAAVVLCETRVTTAKYFAPLLAACSARLTIEGRLRFWGPDAARPDEGHEIFYLGPDPAGFAQHFAPFGKIFSLGVTRPSPVVVVVTVVQVSRT
jgi:DNA N-6-adenine-methyltransferase (Dam)